MTLEDLIVRPEFVMLGQQQQDFTKAYCTNGADRLKAAHAAYSCKDDASAEAIANRNLRHPEIKRLTDEFYNRTDDVGTKSAALAILWARISRTNLDDKVLLDYLKLWGVWNGYETQKAPAPATPPVPGYEDSKATDILNELKET